MKYQSFDPNAELNGTTAQCFVKSIHLQDDYFSEIMVRHGLARLERDQWYSLQGFMDVLTEMSQATDASADFIQLGITAAELGIDLLPPELQTISLRDFLMSYPRVYQSRHRGDVGYIHVEENAPDHYTLRAHIPYPDDIFYGWMWGYVRYFKAPHTGFSISFDATLPRHDQGADETVMHIRIDRK